MYLNTNTRIVRSQYNLAINAIVTGLIDPYRIYTLSRKNNLYENIDLLKR